LGGWLTENLGWRWCFYINLPVGALCALGILFFIRQTGNVRRDPFDGFGFAMLSLGVGALQLMLDRGQIKDWFHSSEIWIEAPRGFGTMLAMFLVARMIDKVDNRLFILVGFLLTAASLWQMTGFSLLMGSGPLIFASFAQGFGLGCTFVPLNLLALSGLPHHILAQGTAIRPLMRMLGGSIGIAILETQLTQNTQIVHSRIIEAL